MTKYDHRAIEPKWQRYWEEQGLYKTSDSAKGKDNYYLLVEFPYPSGNLHVGHWYAFSVPDIYARYLRMTGKNVLYPIGFDAFGLPAENAAIKNEVNPRTWTFDNMDYMRAQIRSMGTSFDWSREVVTCDPDYYRWTQWQFLQFFKKGLAYRKETAVNWCSNCKTVLANEQVVDGHCERCGTEVEQRNMLQWNLKIRDYADRLVDDLDALDWPKEIKESQRNWIGRSEGAEVSFELLASSFEKDKKQNYVLLHGFNGSSKKGFFPWLRAELERRGYDVQAPDLPNPERPTEEEQVSYVLKNIQFDERTVLYGHSLGAVVAMKVAERLEKPIGALVMSGAFVDPHFKDKHRPFETTFTWTFDAEKIKKNARLTWAIQDINDRAVSAEQAARLGETLGIDVKKVTAQQPHFDEDEEPAILHALLPSITVFTTRADTLFGATYLVLSPEHPWVTLATDERHHILKNKEEILRYIAVSKKKTEIERTTEGKEKTGVELKGVKAVNPATKEEIPIWVADFVLAHYGTGAVFADAHDERDFEFAKKYDIPLKTTLKPAGVENDSKIRNLEECYAGKGILYDSGEFTGLTSDEAIPKIAEKFGKRSKQYKLRDWVVSRQRYWGVPIPIVHCPKCGTIPVPDKDLPVLLPPVEDYLPAGDGRSPLAKVREWVEVGCPQCGGKAERETDTFDTFVDSSWYFLRYTDSHNKKEFASRKHMDAWMPIDLYSGGAEHTTMHLLYSRFWQKALFDLGLVADEEPYVRRMNRGLILGPDGQKMSKSRGNVVDPDEVVARLGADTVRMYLAFIGPYHETGSYPWNPDAIVGVRRFLERVWRLAGGLGEKTDEQALRMLHVTIKKVTEDIPALKFNTAIAAMMSFINVAEKSALGKSEYRLFLRICAPFAPHMAEELWQTLGEKGSVHAEQWPSFDVALVLRPTARIAIQINGKVRDMLEVEHDAVEADVLKAALHLPSVQKWVAGAEIRKKVYVPGRLLSIVTEGN